VTAFCHRYFVELWYKIYQTLVCQIQIKNYCMVHIICNFITSILLVQTLIVIFTEINKFSCLLAISLGLVPFMRYGTFSKVGGTSARQKYYRKVLWCELATVTSQALEYDVITDTPCEGLNYTILDKITPLSKRIGESPEIQTSCYQGSYSVISNKPRLFMKKNIYLPKKTEMQKHIWMQIYEIKRWLKYWFTLVPFLNGVSSALKSTFGSLFCYSIHFILTNKSDNILCYRHVSFFRLRYIVAVFLASWQCLFCIFLNSLGFSKFVFVVTQLTSENSFYSDAVNCDKLQIWP